MINQIRYKRYAIQILTFGVIWFIFGVTYVVLEFGLIGNLTEYPTPEGGTDVRHLSKLSIDEATEALQIMEEVKKICLYGGAVFDAKAGLIDTLEAKVNG